MHWYFNIVIDSYGVKKWQSLKPTSLKPADQQTSARLLRLLQLIDAIL
jgi:hypothetical protein